jgi:hypothetical protein
MNWIIVLIIGLFIGANVGYVLAALCAAAGKEYHIDTSDVR